MYCNVCNKYRKSKKTKVSYNFEKALSLAFVYSKCGYEYQKIFNKKNQLKY